MNQDNAFLYICGAERGVDKAHEHERRRRRAFVCQRLVFLKPLLFTVFHVRLTEFFLSAKPFKRNSNV